MQAAKHFSYYLMLLVLALHSSPTMACVCMPSHAQSSYCNGDYAVLVRVLSNNTNLVEDRNVYKVKMQKIYKMTPQGQEILKHNHLQTAADANMCGVSLSLGKHYIIAGKGTDLSACNYIKPYGEVTRFEKQGFSRYYKNGCKCAVKACFGASCAKKVESATGCKWSPFDTCETDYSFCKYSPRARNQCSWVKSRRNTNCVLSP